MRSLAIVYTIAAIWLSAWLSDTFGLSHALFISFIFSSPALLAWQMASKSQPIKRIEYCYFAIAMTLTLAGTVAIVANSYEVGMDRDALFDRECEVFRKKIALVPEFKNVSVTYDHTKGGNVYLHGTVADKETHTQLIRMVDNMLHNNVRGCYDDAKYPGKPMPDMKYPNGKYIDFHSVRDSAPPEDGDQNQH